MYLLSPPPPSFLFLSLRLKHKQKEIKQENLTLIYVHNKYAYIYLKICTQYYNSPTHMAPPLYIISLDAPGPLYRGFPINCHNYTA